MRTVVLVLLLAVAFAHYSEIEKVTLFNQWQLLQNKVYPSEEIEWFRFQAFSANLDLIQQLKQENPEADFAMNQFADLTNEEFAILYFGYIPNEEVSSQNVVEYPEEAIVADEIDWVAKGAVTPVKNQGQCGSCWAFSTTGELEGQNFIKNGELVSLSEQQLVDCDTIDEGCNGGLMDNAFKWIQQNGGIQQEKDYPYRGIKQTCKQDKSKVAVQVTGWHDIKKGDEAAMMTQLNISPISVAIHANGLQLYSGGVFNPVYCSKQLNHGVLGVGYGTAEGKDFWKIKNSWGASWGEKGYFRIIRGKDMCGLADAVSYADVQ